VRRNRNARGGVRPGERYTTWVCYHGRGWVQEERVRPPKEPSKGRGVGWRGGVKGHITMKKIGRLDNDEKSAILLMSGKGRTVDEIAKSLDRAKSTISRFIAEMADTSILARATLKAGAASLAQRVIKKASVTESIEVLSRPGMDVLQPAQLKGGGAGNFRVSVGVGSCGTVVQVESGDVQSSAQRLESGLRGTEAQNTAEYSGRHGGRPEYASVTVKEIQGP